MEEQFYKASFLPFWWRVYFFFRNILVKLHILKPINWMFYEKEGVAIGSLQSVRVVGGGRKRIRRGLKKCL
ncbi:MAG: hypothetical protein WC444_04270 [Candidatus Paceibacterota bacterium]